MLKTLCSCSFSKYLKIQKLETVIFFQDHCSNCKGGLYTHDFNYLELLPLLDIRWCLFSSWNWVCARWLWYNLRLNLNPYLSAVRKGVASCVLNDLRLGCLCTAIPWDFWGKDSKIRNSEMGNYTKWALPSLACLEKRMQKRGYGKYGIF